MRVIVVGAGLVGLSISHALQLANISHIVLEKHDKIVSVHGAALVSISTIYIYTPPLNQPSR
jgi:FAD dependent monooxygenase